MQKNRIFISTLKKEKVTGRKCRENVCTSLNKKYRESNVNKIRE